MLAKLDPLPALRTVVRTGLVTTGTRSLTGAPRCRFPTLTRLHWRCDQATCPTSSSRPERRADPRARWSPTARASGCSATGLTTSASPPATGCSSSARSSTRSATRPASSPASSPARRCCRSRCFDVSTTLGLIEREQATVVPGPPTLYTAFLEHQSRTAHDLSSVRLAVTGGSNVPTELIRRMRKSSVSPACSRPTGFRSAAATRPAAARGRRRDRVNHLRSSRGRRRGRGRRRRQRTAPGRRGRRGAGPRLQRDARLLERPGGHRGGDRRRRLAAHRRRRCPRRGRQPEHHRPAQGHVRRRRLQRLPGGGRAGARPARGRVGGGRHRRTGRTASARSARRSSSPAPGQHRASRRSSPGARSGSRATRCRAPSSSSTPCRATRQGRSTRSCLRAERPSPG